MKKIFCVALLIFPLVSFAQTYIGLTLGKEFIELDTYGWFADTWSEKTKGSGRIDVPINIGLHLEQHLSDKFFISHRSNFFETKISGYYFENNLLSQVGYTSTNSSYLGNSTSLNMKLSPYWEIGLGLDYHIKRKNSWYIHGEEDLERSYEREKGRTHTELGGHFLTRFNYHNFFSELSYSYRRLFTYGKDLAKGYNRDIFWVSRGLSCRIGYRIQIFKNPIRPRSRKRVQCAKF